MAKRPGLLDLRANSNHSATSTSSKPLRSPRMHIAGEAPPELSPLDAFALQSRLLAKQLQDSNRDGNRMSRLPPLTVESPLIQQGRSDYFRSLSYESSEPGASPDPDAPSLGLKTAVEEAFPPDERPRSMHPRMSHIPPTPDDTTAVPTIPQRARDRSRGRAQKPVGEQVDFFGARRERSPSPLRSDTNSYLDRSPARRDDALPLSASRTSASAAGSPEKPKQGSLDELGLAPPRTLFPGRSSSNLSSPGVVDDDTSSNMTGSFHSLPPRKLSSGSAAFAAAGAFQRSPSVASDSSALPRPSFNFSRPLSRAGTPGLDMPTRQASSDSQPSFILADESAHTPVSMHSEAFPDHHGEDGRAAAPSYIYSKFALPRGKMVQREDHPADQEQAPASPGGYAHRRPPGAPPSPPTRPSSSSARSIPDDAVSMVSSLTRPSLDASSRSTEGARPAQAGLASPGRSRPSADADHRSEDAPRGRTRNSPPHDAARRGKAPASVDTSDSASTIRPPLTARSAAPLASEMTAEEHLSKGIECHENGSLNESTYHLRHAARLNDPTAMLLYALACRHGWGMRANQREGVQWLRKAAEHASVEIADDEDRAKGGRPANFLETRARKAQFALSIYELGVSHMNGWGIEQDKSLALRCFEIAGTWGDVDALAEAGFCYAQGVGCKKDLKKSAKFYRMAEAKGMSMVGNSWIHKSKYNDDGDDASRRDKNGKKARSKSRTRTMFGLK